MSIKPLKPVRTLNQAFAPDLSKSVSWSLFMEHAARALTCKISNPLDRAEVDISHSGCGLSRPQVGFVHCCGLINLEGMLHINTQSPNNRLANQSWIRASGTLAVLKHIICLFKGFNLSLMSFSVSDVLLTVPSSIKSHSISFCFYPASFHLLALCQHSNSHQVFHLIAHPHSYSGHQPPAVRLLSRPPAKVLATSDLKRIAGLITFWLEV